MKENFDDILNYGEKITKVMKPNKSVYVKATVVFMLVCALFGLLVIGIFTYLGIRLGSTNEEASLVFIILAASLGIALELPAITIFFITWFYRSKSYQNTFYAITNKRLIIRLGVLGTDYKSIDLSDISAVEPKVSLLDKVGGKNTGSILIGSPTRPIISYQQNSAGGGSFRFSNIDNPYKLAKEIKELADKSKVGEKAVKSNKSSGVKQSQKKNIKK